MKYALIYPGVNHVTENPGCVFIADGIRHLILQNDPDAIFIPIEMLVDDPDGWECAKSADVVILCGNPRFNGTEETTYWDWGIWDRIRECGVPFIDAWVGAAHSFPNTDNMHDALLSVRKNKQVLRYEAEAARCIARDPVAYKMLAGVNENTTLLPCSAWYAPAYNHVEPRDKTRHAIVLRKMVGQEWILERAADVKILLSNERETAVVCHTVDDWRWAGQGLCISDPRSLLSFYATVDKLVSFRVHATIPALALGSQVCNLSIDSRSLTVDQFGIESLPFTTFGNLVFSRCTPPPYEYMKQALVL